MAAVWTEQCLGDVLTLEYGKPLPKENRHANGLYPVYGANGVKARSDQFYCSKRSIVVGRKGSAGELNLTEGSFWPLDVTYFVTFDESKYDLQFLYYLLSTLRLPSLAKGVKPGLNRNDVYAARALVPPLPEQRRIVGILDEAFAGLAVARANAEANLKNARALFESHLNEVFTQRGDGWEDQPLEDLVESDCSLSYGIVQPGDDVPKGLPVVRPTDLTRKTVTLSGLKRIDPKKAESYQRTKLRGGELLLCVRGTTGAVAIADSKLAGGNVTRGLVPIRFDQDAVDQRFAFFALCAGPVQTQIRAKTYGTALMQINIRDLRKVVLPHPVRKACQSKIASGLESVSAATDRLVVIYEQKLAALDELKASLLRQAFSGKL